MRIFMSPTFIEEVRKLVKSKDHADCEKTLIESVYSKTLDEIIQGGAAKKLGGTPDTPFIRRRLQGQGTGKSAGYRLYLWAFRLENDIYLIYMHPKTGRRSAVNISSDYQKELVREFKKFRDAGDMVLTKLSKDGSKILVEGTTTKTILD